MLLALGQQVGSQPASAIFSESVSLLVARSYNRKLYETI